MVHPPEGAVHSAELRDADIEDTKFFINTLGEGGHLLVINPLEITRFVFIFSY
jgi:hypothetical protein